MGGGGGGGGVGRGGGQVGELVGGVVGSVVGSGVDIGDSDTDTVGCAVEAVGAAVASAHVTEKDGQCELYRCPLPACTIADQSPEASSGHCAALLMLAPLPELIDPPRPFVSRFQYPPGVCARCQCNSVPPGAARLLSRSSSCQTPRPSAVWSRRRRYSPTAPVAIPS